jgi:transcriptional regulator with XRE-family HTH domain
MKKWNDIEKSIQSLSGSEKAAMDAVTKLVVIMIERRIELGWSQEELAERAGVQRSAVGRLETLGAVPRVDTLQKIAQALHLKIALVDEDAAAYAG